MPRTSPWCKKRLTNAGTVPKCALAAHLPREDQHHLWRLLVLASLESTTTALAHMMLQLCQPEGWAQAQQRRAHFVEELLRVNPPLHRFGRLALQTHRLGDTEIQAGQRVVSSSRPPTVAPGPDKTTSALGLEPIVAPVPEWPAAFSSHRTR